MSLVLVLSDAFSAVFLATIVSYYAIALFPKRRYPRVDPPSIAVIVPARNEQAHLGAALDALQSQEYAGSVSITVVDDASADETARIAGRAGVTVLRNETQLGKAGSINRALAETDGDVVIIVDADSVVERRALAELVRPFADERVGAVTSTITVRNRNRLPNPFVQLELIHASLTRSILSRVNGNIVTPGPLSAYSRVALERIGGFPEDVLLEDTDVTIRLIRAGYDVAVASRARVRTVMPASWREFRRQRTRFARGMAYILRRHLRPGLRVIDWYSLPLLLFIYLQSVIMTTINAGRIVELIVRYGTSFASIGRIALDWFTVLGTVDWMRTTIAGLSHVAVFDVIGIGSALLSYPLFLIAIVRYDRLSLRDLIALFFMPAWWFFLAGFYLLSLRDAFVGTQVNAWRKNEA